MKIFKDKEPKVEQDPTQPLGDTSETVSENEDRSAYSCSACSGEGLIYDEASKKHVLCPQCGGTGKVN